MFTEGAFLTAAIKFLGSLGGAILALIFLPPKTRREFIQRAAFSLLAGLLLSELMRELLRMPDTIPMSMASAALTALISWWALGMAVRLFGKWQGPK